MNTGKDIVLVVDYHAENIVYRWFNEATGEELAGKYSTGREEILRQVEEARSAVVPDGEVVWIMESTTGWARVKELLEGKVRFVLANVLQMPLPPKARRRKTDKIDTGRLLREYLSGRLPQSFTPARWWREVRRLVDFRQDLVERSTALKNQVTSLLSHETWRSRENLWSGKGLKRLAAAELSPGDRALVALKLQQLELLDCQRATIEKGMQEIYRQWPEAQWVDEIRGIGMIMAVSILAHIGPIERFATAEDLIGYAGLAPGTRQSDSTLHHGRIGGGGTDGHLRYLLIEAATWLCQIPRYRTTYERIVQRRGRRIGRIVVARMVLRSIHKMLTAQVRFNPGKAA
ncbi:MAG TPA: IS110 family transposase [Phycisphaerae bacterium]|nr:IS110 family transposase [Phycisphaerae bacterium]